MVGLGQGARAGGHSTKSGRPSGVDGDRGGFFRLVWRPHGVQGPHDMGGRRSNDGHVAVGGCGRSSDGTLGLVCGNAQGLVPNEAVRPHSARSVDRCCGCVVVVDFVGSGAGLCRGRCDGDSVGFGIDGQWVAVAGCGRAASGCGAVELESHDDHRLADVDGLSHVFGHELVRHLAGVSFFWKRIKSVCTD